jgi:hypothetical protein
MERFRSGHPASFDGAGVTGRDWFGASPAAAPDAGIGPRYAGF